ncbi:hypothetical protein REY47_11505 [Escherichia coli]|nr:hypothetical protein [Escherichia coli]MDQ8128725.1 hypothetical protein [Escherichia coli]
MDNGIDWFFNFLYVKKGIFTRDRKPKSAAFLLQKRWTGMNFGEKPQQGGKQ